MAQKSTWNKFHNILFRLFDGMILHGWSTCNLIWLMRLRFCYSSIIVAWIMFFKMLMIDIERLILWSRLWVCDTRVRTICDISKYHASYHVVTCIHVVMGYGRVDSRLAPSQWKTTLQSNAVSHWLGVNLESSLYGSHYSPMLFRTSVIKLIITCIS